MSARISKSGTAVNALTVLYKAQDTAAGTVLDAVLAHEGTCVATVLFIRATLRSKAATAGTIADAGKAHVAAFPATAKGLVYGNDVSVGDAGRVGRIAAYVVGTDKRDARTVLDMIQDIRKAREILGASSRKDDEHASVDEMLDAADRDKGMTRGAFLARLADVVKGATDARDAREAADAAEAAEMDGDDAPEAGDDARVTATFGQIVEAAGAMLRNGHEMTEADAAIVATFLAIVEAARATV